MRCKLSMRSLSWVKYLVDVLRESLERDGSESSLSGDQISKGSSQRSSHGSVIDVRSSHREELGVSLSLSLVETMDGLVTGARERSSVSRGIVRSVEVGVAVGGVVVQRICFRLSQDKRGYGENSDLKRESEDDVEDDDILPCTSCFYIDWCWTSAYPG